MDISKLPPAHQLAWARSKLVSSVFLNDIDGCRWAWRILKENRNIAINRIPNQDFRLKL